MPRVARVIMLMALIPTALFGASAASASAARANVEVSEEQYATAYNRSLCYGGTTVRTPTIDEARRAGLVAESPAEGGYVLTSDNVAWGQCPRGGEPAGLSRLASADPVVYTTACDGLSAIGGMRVSYGFVGGVQELGVVYLLYDLEEDVCELNTGVTPFYTESGEDWAEECLSHAILVVFGGPEDFMPLVQFRCGSGGVEL